MLQYFDATFILVTGNACAHSRENAPVGTKGDLYGHDWSFSIDLVASNMSTQWVIVPLMNYKIDKGFGRRFLFLKIHLIPKQLKIVSKRFRAKDKRCVYIYI